MVDRGERRGPNETGQLALSTATSPSVGFGKNRRATAENANPWKTALLEDGAANGWHKNSREIPNAPLGKATLPRTWRARLGAGRTAPGKS